MGPGNGLEVSEKRKIDFFPTGFGTPGHPVRTLGATPTTYFFDLTRYMSLRLHRWDNVKSLTPNLIDYFSLGLYFKSSLF